MVCHDGKLYQVSGMILKIFGLGLWMIALITSFIMYINTGLNNTIRAYLIYFFLRIRSVVTINVINITQ
jgi:hypothetical protein